MTTYKVVKTIPPTLILQRLLGDKTVKTYTIDTNVLKALALFQSDQKDVRYYLQALHFKSNGGAYRMTASDGCTLATTEVPGEWEPVDIILPSKAIDIALKATGKGKTLDLLINGTVYTLAGIPFTPVDGHYPNVQRIWGGEADGKPCTISPEYYARLGKVAKLLKSDLAYWYDSERLYFRLGPIKGLVMPMRTKANNGDTPRF